MPEVFYTGMLGPYAVKKLNELQTLAENSAAGIATISTDPGNIITLGSDNGIYASGLDPESYFKVENRFYEIAEDETAKQAARENLGLATIDGGTFN